MVLNAGQSPLDQITQQHAGKTISDIPRCLSIDLWKDTKGDFHPNTFTRKWKQHSLKVCLSFFGIWPFQSGFLESCKTGVTGRSFCLGMGLWCWLWGVVRLCDHLNVGVCNHNRSDLSACFANHSQTSSTPNQPSLCVKQSVLTHMHTQTVHVVLQGEWDQWNMSLTIEFPFWMSTEKEEAMDAKVFFPSMSSEP